MATRPKRAEPAQSTSAELEEMREQLNALEAESATPEESYRSPSLDRLYAEMDLNESYDSPRVFVYKLDYDGNGSEGRVWEGDPDGYDLEKIAKKFGSGQYRVKIYARNEGGWRVIRGNKVFGYLLTPEDEARRKQMLEAPLPPLIPTPAALSANDIRQIVVDTMTMMQPTKPEPIDPMAQLRGLSEVMRNLQPPAPAQGMDQFGMFERALSMVKSLQSDVEPIDRGVNASTTDVLLGMLKTFGAPIAQAMTQAQPQLGQAQPAQAQLPQPTAPQAQPTTPQPTEDDVTFKLKMGLKLLISAAEKDADPATYAELILDHLSDEEVKQLTTLPDPITVFTQFDPGVEKHRAWMLKVIEELKTMLTEDEEPKP